MQNERSPLRFSPSSIPRNRKIVKRGEEVLAQIRGVSGKRRGMISEDSPAVKTSVRPQKTPGEAL